MNNPFLSIVIVGRNDNYGGDFTDRLQKCLDWNTALLEKNKISTEIIFVNWNPVAENKPLKESINFSVNRKFVTYKIITVPPEVHQQYVNTSVRQTVQLFEFVAKNVGIRRAQGEYILCMNADILIHPKIFEFISGNKLEKTEYYRADRLDFKNENSSNSINEFYKSGFAVSLKGFLYFFNSFFRKKTQYIFFRIINKMRLSWEFWKLTNEKICNLLKIPVNYNNAEYHAHCHNSGDFMLMNKQHWHALRAYPESTTISTHTDALFTVFAFSLLKEQVFPFPVFHQEHQRRYTWDEIKQEDVFLKAYSEFQNIAQQILSGKRADDFLNNENWGLQKFTLEEKVF